jgi:hypothetical protein
MTKTFSGFDKFGLEPFADMLTNYLQVESNFVDESYVLSLNSGFGSGKSTFFEMWANKLTSSGDNVFKVVSINAWESDFQGDPLLAIVSYLLQVFPPSKGSKKDIESIKETTGKLCKFALSVGNDVVQKFTGIDVIKAGRYAEPEESKTETELGHACFQLYQERRKLFEKLKGLLRKITGDHGQSTLIIIDELDRCKPNYAIEFLETIKHFFDIKGLIFVIGVDKGQLSSSAKALFGHDLDFDEYYRKFAHRNVSLPVNTKTMTKNFCQKIVKEYLTPEAFARKGRFSYAEYSDNFTNYAVDLCIAFSLNARQIHEVLRITAHVFSITKEENANRLLWGWQIGTLFMSAISINNHDLYDRIGNRKITPSEFTEFLKPLTFATNLDWWAALLYTGIFGFQQDKLEPEFQELGIWDSSKNEKEIFNENFGFAARAFLLDRGRGQESVFSNIYEKLEGLSTFER